MNEPEIHIMIEGIRVFGHQWLQIALILFRHTPRKIIENTWDMLYMLEEVYIPYYKEERKQSFGKRKKHEEKVCVQTHSEPIRPKIHNIGRGKMYVNAAGNKFKHLKVDKIDNVFVRSKGI